MTDASGASAALNKDSCRVVFVCRASARANARRVRLAAWFVLRRRRPLILTRLEMSFSIACSGAETCRSIRKHCGQRKSAEVFAQGIHKPASGTVAGRIPVLRTSG